MNKINLTLTIIVSISIGYVYLNTQEEVSSIISQQVETEGKLSTIISQQTEAEDQINDEINKINTSLSKLSEVGTQLKNHSSKLSSLENKFKDFEKKILDKYIEQKNSSGDLVDLGDEFLYSDGFLCNLKLKYFKERCNYIFTVFSEKEGDILEIYPAQIIEHQIVLADKDGFLIDNIIINDDNLTHNANTNVLMLEGNIEMKEKDYYLIDHYLHVEISD